MKDKVIMIGGMPRSGTTLMANCIQDSLHIPICPETHFFNAALDNTGKVSIKFLPEAVLKDNKLGPIYYSLDGKVAEDKFEIFEKILKRTLDKNYQVYGEKTPAHLMFFKEILENKNNYIFIILQRSCAEVCNSLKAVPWNNGNIIKNAVRWAKYYSEAQNLLNKHPERCLIVNYAGLCKNPDKTLIRIKTHFKLEQINQEIDGFVNFSESLEPWKKGSAAKPRTKTNKLENMPKAYIPIINAFESFVRATNYLKYDFAKSLRKQK